MDCRHGCNLKRSHCDHVQLAHWIADRMNENDSAQDDKIAPIFVYTRQTVCSLTLTQLRFETRSSSSKHYTFNEWHQVIDVHAQFEKQLMRKKIVCYWAKCSLAHLNTIAFDYSLTNTRHIQLTDDNLEILIIHKRFNSIETNLFELTYNVNCNAFTHQN